TVWLARLHARDLARKYVLHSTAWLCVTHMRTLQRLAIATAFCMAAQLQPLVERMRHATDRSTASGPRRAGWAAWGVWAVDLGLAPGRPGPARGRPPLHPFRRGHGGACGLGAPLPGRRRAALGTARPLRRCGEPRLPAPRAALDHGGAPGRVRPLAGPPAQAS